jgi:hypothetical protein
LLDVITLKAALDKEIQFMVELVLEQAIMSPLMIHTLLLERQQKLLISLILRLQRPNYNPPNFSIIKLQTATYDQAKAVVRMLHFVDIIDVSIHYGHKSQVTIELIRLMQSEIDKKGGFPTEL